MGLVEVECARVLHLRARSSAALIWQAAAVAFPASVIRWSAPVKDLLKLARIMVKSDGARVAQALSGGGAVNMLLMLSEETRELFTERN